MKSLIYLLCLGIIIQTSCKKQVAASVDNATLMVINSNVGLTSMQFKLNNDYTYYKTAVKTNFGAGTFFYAKKGMNTFTTVNSADSAKFILNGSLNFPGKIYTMYVIGQVPTIDTLLREETSYPFVPVDKVTTDADSIINIRFVNLSPNSSPIKINIKGNTANEVSSLAYKGIVPFKAYPALPANASYIFEVRDVATSNLLLTYTLSVTTTNRFKNVALVLRGLSGTTTGTSALAISPVNYF